MRTSVTRALHAAAAAGTLAALGLAAPALAGAAAAPATMAKPAHPVTVYVANSYDGTVTAINAATGEVIKTIAVGLNDTVIAITPEREDRLRRQPQLRRVHGTRRRPHPRRHRDSDQYRHQHRRPADQGGPQPRLHRDHAVTTGQPGPR